MFFEIIFNILENPNVTRLFDYALWKEYLGIFSLSSMTDIFHQVTQHLNYHQWIATLYSSTACCSPCYRFLLYPFYHSFSSLQHLVVSFVVFLQSVVIFFFLFVIIVYLLNAEEQIILDLSTLLMYSTAQRCLFCALLISWCSVVFLVTNEPFTICFHSTICRGYRTSSLRTASSFVTACAGRFAHYTYLLTLNSAAPLLPACSSSWDPSATAGKPINVQSTKEMLDGSKLATCLNTRIMHKVMCVLSCQVSHGTFWMWTEFFFSSHCCWALIFI